ncbi:MAG: tetratricopeptide repeat protein [Bacteroidales bacterium]
MNRIFTAIIISVLAFPASMLYAQGDCSSCTIYRGYISGKMEVWKSGMKELQVQFRSDPKACTLYTLAEARYGYIGYLLGINQKDVARPVIDTFAIEVEQLAAYPEYRAETEAFRVALLGFRMGLNPARAVTLGPKALKQLEKAIEVGNDSPAVWIEKANSEAHMPAFAGGSKEKAAVSFREALRLFEAEGTVVPCNWRYLNTMVLSGQLLERMGDYRGAAEAYRRALRRDPDFQWVRDELLPEAEKKIK